MKLKVKMCPEQSNKDCVTMHEIVGAKPSEVDQYIEDNITDLESAKEFLKVLAKIVVLRV